MPFAGIGRRNYLNDDMYNLNSAHRPYLRFLLPSFRSIHLADQSRYDLRHIPQTEIAGLPPLHPLATPCGREAVGGAWGYNHNLKLHTRFACARLVLPPRSQPSIFVSEEPWRLSRISRTQDAPTSLETRLVVWRAI